MSQKNTYIISLGGSLIAPPKGVDWQYLKKFRLLILNQVKKGNKFFIIAGGGTTARVYQNAAKRIVSVPNYDLDWLGIYSSRLNARLVKIIFLDHAHSEIIKNPTIKTRSKNKIIVGGGWKPGWSTDYVATVLAEHYKIKNIINLSNIDYVYTRDPKKYKTAKKITDISWKDFTKIVGDEWIPGASKPFDPIASKKAKRLKLEVAIMNGKNLKNLKDYFNNKKFKGTVIK